MKNFELTLENQDHYKHSYQIHYLEFLNLQVLMKKDLLDPIQELKNLEFLVDKHFHFGLYIRQKLRVAIYLG